jgi:hypothetical protein
LLGVGSPGLTDQSRLDARNWLQVSSWWIDRPFIVQKQNLQPKSVLFGNRLWPKSGLDGCNFFCRFDQSRLGVGRSRSSTWCVCFFVLCNRHWFNKAPGPDQGDRLTCLAGVLRTLAAIATLPGAAASCGTGRFSKLSQLKKIKKLFL